MSFGTNFHNFALSVQVKTSSVNLLNRLRMTGVRFPIRTVFLLHHTQTGPTAHVAQLQNGFYKVRYWNVKLDNQLCPHFEVNMNTSVKHGLWFATFVLSLITLRTSDGVC
jgi:hypothetical protein